MNEAPNLPLPPGTRPIDKSISETSKLRANSGTVEIGLPRSENDNDRVGELDFSDFEEGEVPAPAEPEPEELNEAYLKDYMAEIPAGKDPSTAAYPADVRSHQEAILNQNPAVSREVDSAFAQMVDVNAPPGTMAIPRAEIESVEDFNGQHYSSVGGAALAEEEDAALRRAHEEVTGLYDFNTLRKLKDSGDIKSPFAKFADEKGRLPMKPVPPPIPEAAKRRVEPPEPVEEPAPPSRIANSPLAKFADEKGRLRMKPVPPPITPEMREEIRVREANKQAAQDTVDTLRQKIQES